MQIVIDIPEKRYKDILRIADVQLENKHFKTAEQIIAKGTPLPKGHGRLIDADKIAKQYGLDDATKYGNKNAKQQAFSYSTMMMYEIADMIDG